MENAIWTIFYDVPNEGRDEYLNWFHQVHIPATLLRKGYLWAAHYQVVPKKQRANARRSDAPALPEDTGYAILYGGESTRTFLDPSPMQLKSLNDTKTQEMMARRIHPVAYIHTVEWRAEGLESNQRDPSGKPAPFIQMGLFDASGQDEDLGAWYAQERMVLWSRTPGSVTGRKLLATVGPQRHAVLYDFTSVDVRKNYFPGLNATDWTSRVHSYLVHPRGSAFLGRRIWPPA
jgi:hypothetical protein